MLVGRRMTKDPKTVSPEDTLARAADIMRELRFNHLPVVEEEKLVGILTDTDLRNVSLTGQPPEGAYRLPDRKVREVMKTEVWSLTPEDAVEDALLIIRRKKFGALPVLSGDRLVGIITKIDLLNAVIDVLNLEEVGVRVEVTFPRSMARYEEMIATLEGMGVRVRSCVVTPDGTGHMTALVRLDTIDGRAVIAALRAKGFVVPGRAEIS